MKTSKRNFKSRAFTITEIIATLVILGVVLVIAIPGVNKLQEKFMNDYYEQLEGSVVASAKSYYKDNAELRLEGKLALKKLEYDSLMGKKYIDKIDSYNSNDSCTGFVVVIKKDDKYEYKNCMECNNYVTVHENPDYCAAVDHDVKKSFKAYDGSDFNTDSVLYIYADNYSSEQIKNILSFKETYYVDGYDSDIKVETSEVLYPNNITGVDLKNENVFNKDGKKIKKAIKVVYENGSNDIEKDIVVYKYSAPQIDSNDGKISLSGDNTLELSTMYFADESHMSPKMIDNIIYLLPYESIVGNHKFVGYQYQLNNDDWKDLSCTFDENSSKCKINIPGNLIGKVKFRVVGEDSEQNKYYGKATNEFDVTKRYTVTYATTEGSGVENLPAVQTKIHGVNLTLTTDKPTKLGYTFVKWNTNSDGTGTNYTSGGTYATDANIVLYPIFEANTYTVTFDPNNGSVNPTTKTVKYDSTYGELPTPTREGYTFEGWYSSRAGGFKVIESSKVTITSNQTLYALWGATDYNIEFNANGGTGTTSPVSCIYDTNCPLTSNGFAKTGYNFAGWATSSGGAVVYSNNASVKNLSSTKGATVTLYAKWTPITYKIVFNANGGTGTTNTKTCTYNVDCVLTSNGFSNGSHVFSGWATSSGGVVVYSNGDTVKNLASTQNATITLYAKWVLPVEGSVTTASCKSVSLPTGIYYIEITGGGAGGLGSGTNYGGNSARWAGYVQLPQDTYQLCAGKGSAGMNGGVGIAAIFLGTKIANGNPSYIATSAGTQLVTAQGGISYDYKPYTNSSVTFTSGVKKSQCNYVGGKQCASTKSAGSTDCAKKNSSASSFGYGIGGYREYNGGKMGNGYSGTNGLIFYKYIMSSEQWNSRPETCPSQPYFCNTTLCKWENWPTS